MAGWINGVAIPSQAFTLILNVAPGESFSFAVTDRALIDVDATDAGVSAAALNFPSAADFAYPAGEYVGCIEFFMEVEPRTSMGRYYLYRKGTMADRSHVSHQFFDPAYTLGLPPANPGECTMKM